MTDWLSDRQGLGGGSTDRKQRCETWFLICTEMTISCTKVLVLAPGALGSPNTVPPLFYFKIIVKREIGHLVAKATPTVNSSQGFGSFTDPLSHISTQQLFRY